MPPRKQQRGRDRHELRRQQGQGQGEVTASSQRTPPQALVSHRPLAAAASTTRSRRWPPAARRARPRRGAPPAGRRGSSPRRRPTSRASQAVRRMNQTRTVSQVPGGGAAFARSDRRAGCRVGPACCGPESARARACRSCVGGSVGASIRLHLIPVPRPGLVPSGRGFEPVPGRPVNVRATLGGASRLGRPAASC